MSLTSSGDNLIQALSELLQGGLASDVSAIDVEALTEIVGADFTIIQLDQSTDSQKIARDYGLSVDFVKSASLGSDAHAKNVKRLLNLPEIGSYAYKTSHRTDVNIYTLHRGAKPILSPFSGEVKETRTSLGRNWFLLNDQGKYCLVSEHGEPMTFMGIDGVWVFPDQKLILWHFNGFGENALISHVAQFFDRLLRHAPMVAEHVGRNDAPLMVLTDFWCPHVCHNFWNVITGWANVLRYRQHAKVDAILEYDNQNFYGLVHDLFADQVKGIPSEVCNSDDDALRFVLSRNALLIGVKDENISKDLADRVLAHARSRVSPEFLKEVEEFAASTRPLVLITLRLDNRTWLEQGTGFVELFIELKKTFPDVGVLIDGLSSDSVKGWTTGWMSLENELTLANEIRDGLIEYVPVIFGVGRTFFESIVLSSYAQAFVAPIGSGMTIYKWITNKPGVAFSNRTALNDDRVWTPLRVWDHYCEQIMPAVYIGADKVQDVEDPRQDVSRANFTMKVEDLVATVEPMLREKFPHYIRHDS